ncbi:hypothetical protein LP52_06690 [Streptomonospora alba]|uniref:DUF3817 domain-containing protein n=1 Tax=Streptomonospora alba TaxID=183763 RepID=A0A0C2FJP5_9ACTN|nr:hypothetical protein [Streptomonospora alba]KIH99559.1 hypothetical protein LP52_06690 [Streptomonospora alba]
MNPRGTLRLAGVIEPATLLVMLLNMATYHLPAVSSVLGPLHGLAYATTVIAAILVNGRHRVWLLALIPGIGGLLAARHATRSTLVS